MSDRTDPLRIYLRPECCADPTWGREWARQPGEDCEDGVPWAPYVRADVLEGIIRRCEDPRYRVSLESARALDSIRRECRQALGVDPL